MLNEGRGNIEGDGISFLGAATDEAMSVSRRKSSTQALTIHRWPF